MSRFATSTDVPVSRSQAEIHATVTRYGADAYSFGQETTDDGERAIVQFRAQGRLVRFELDLPHRADFAKTETGRERSDGAVIKAWEQACRQRWRALLLVIKARLEAVDSGINTFDVEFMPFIVLPDGSTVAEHAIPAIQSSYESGAMPRALLPGSTS